MGNFEVYGYYEDEDKSNSFLIDSFTKKDDAYEFAYDYEADHDGFIRTYVKVVKSKSSVKKSTAKQKSVSKKPVAKKVSTVSKSADTYVIMGRWVDDDKVFKIGTSKSYDDARDKAYEYEADHDGLCETWVTKSAPKCAKIVAVKKKSSKKSVR